MEDTAFQFRVDLEVENKVIVEIKASPDAYEGTTANGVTSLPYGRWPDGAFKFLRVIMQ